jgi:hypothetical protein
MQSNKLINNVDCVMYLSVTECMGMKRACRNNQTSGKLEKTVNFQS